MQSQERPGSCRVKCLNGEKVARRLEGDAVVGSRSETWQRRELCCSKKESRVSCRGLCWSNSGLASNLHASRTCSWGRSSAGDGQNAARPRGSSRGRGRCGCLISPAMADAQRECDGGPGCARGKGLAVENTRGRRDKRQSTNQLNTQASLDGFGTTKPGEEEERGGGTMLVEMTNG